MRILTALFIGVFVLFSSQAYSQKLSKEELKQWKNEVKKYKKNPAALKQLTEEHRLYRKEKENLERQLAGLQSQQGQGSDELNRKEQQVVELNNQLMNAQSTITQLQNELANARQAQPSSTGPDLMLTGLAFRVQIGAYKSVSAPTIGTGDEMTLETVDGVQKIMIGRFRDYEQAKELMKYFKQIGIKDAWVVAYQDGQRISLEEALGSGNY